MTSLLVTTLIDVLAILLTVTHLTAELTNVSGLQCYICDSTSYVSYSDAETECNRGSLRRCPDTEHSACMIEAFKRDGPVYHVVKKCRNDCPVLINSTAQHIRCCFKDACNDLITIASEAAQPTHSAPVERTSTSTTTTTVTTSETPDYHNQLDVITPNSPRPSYSELHPPTVSFDFATRQRPRPSTLSATPPPRRRWPPRRGRYPPTRHRYGRRPHYRSSTGRHPVSTLLTVITVLMVVNI